MNNQVIAPEDLLGDSGVMRAGVDRLPIDRITELRLRLLAFDAALDTGERILQPSLVDFLS
ncbi:MAG TPA: hypothetical protein VM938_03565 [Acidimicrobiales bacterium]|nr:hypothetical protein [Acidimicrobiales bacterium]